MATKEETALQARLQTLIRKRGGYVKKNHGNMITVKGLADLSFTYRGLAVFWEVKLPGYTKKDISVEQGIHCRLARKAGGITAIISNIETGNYILDLIDEFISDTNTFHSWFFHKRYITDMLNKELKVWDDGTSY